MGQPEAAEAVASEGVGSGLVKDKGRTEVLDDLLDRWLESREVCLIRCAIG